MFLDYNIDWTDHHKQIDIVEISNTILANIYAYG